MAKHDELKQYEESIRNYGDKIKKLSYVESVRRLPGLYIGSIGDEGWKGCVREIIQNAFDEAVRKDSPCNYVKIVYDERNQSAIVEDNGRGVPHGKMQDIYSEDHTSSHYENTEGSEYSSGVHGTGAGVAMSLSKRFVSTSYVLGVAHEIEFESGNIIKKEHKIQCPKNRQGTTVYLEPDTEIMGVITLSCNDIYIMVSNIVPLLPINTKVDFTGINTNGSVVINESIINRDGLYTFLQRRMKSPLITPIAFSCDTKVMKAEAVFSYDSVDLTSAENIISFANFTNTTGGGTHVQGFLDGVCTYLRNYMNKIYLGPKSKISVINNDIKTGLYGIISVAHINPIFMGQFKGILSNGDMQEFVKKLTMETLDNWSKTSPNELQKLCKFIKEVAEIRLKSEGEKVKLSNNYNKSSITGLPEKYVEPTGNKNLELFIVEGDSALGPSVSARDHTFQGVFPIRGKLPNCFKESKAKILSNAEISAIIKIIGGGYGRDFDISKVKWDKVIIFADADADGSHIATLFLRFILVYMPGLIQAGKVYKSVPPLYGIQQGKNTKYFATTPEFIKYIQSIFFSKHSFTDVTGRKIPASQATNIFYTNRKYIRDIQIISDSYAIDLSLLEAVLYELAPYIEIGSSAMVSNMAGKTIKTKKKKTIEDTSTKKIPKIEENEDEDEIDEVIAPVSTMSVVGKNNFFIRPSFNPDAMIKRLKKKFRFLKASKTKEGVIFLSGLVNSKSQYVFLSDKFINACLHLINVIKNNDEYYIVDGEKVSIYGLMIAFENAKPPRITRYKGLGEQNPEQLADSAMRPDKSRTLIRYTMDSAVEEINSIKATESNMYALLRDIKIDRDEIE